MITKTVVETLQDERLAYELALADLIDQLARGIRQTRNGEEPLAWRPEEVRI